MMLVFGAIIFCDVILCFGPFHLGIKGIGISWAICSLLGITLNFHKLNRSSLSVICDVRAACREGLSLVRAKRFLTIGFPSCLHGLALIGGSLGIFLVLSKAPDSLVAQAAWAAGWRLEETLTLMPMYGLNLAAAAIEGASYTLGTIGTTVSGAAKVSG